MSILCSGPYTQFIIICLLLILMLWCMQAIFRIERRHVAFLCWMQVSKLGSMGQQIAIPLTNRLSYRDQTKNLKSIASPFDEPAFSPFDFTVGWLSHLALAIYMFVVVDSLLWRHNERNGVSNHPPHDCLLNRSSRPRSKKTSNLCVTGLCADVSAPGQPFEYWIEHVTFGLPYAMFRFSSRIFYRGVPGFTTDFLHMLFWSLVRDFSQKLFFLALVCTFCTWNDGWLNIAAVTSNIPVL